MIQSKELLDSLTTSGPLGTDLLARAVDVLSDCEEAVTACAVGMLAQQHGDMRAAIAHHMDCADVTAATRRLLTRGAPDRTLLTAQVEADLIACQVNHDLCAAHAAHHEHCRICSEATGQALDVCREILAAVRA
ncbi:hypothetical protein ACHBTE_00495 [Streptomyces sp. M41]|uniref:hypothetical protein n=1 Tax=Streptomyces sp. M41 TaxID=3059412 RepID=UPI00374DF75B